MHVFGIRVPLRRLAGIEQLSAAERSVLRGLARGAMSAEAIARERAVSSNTLGKQVASIFSKLGVRSRAELARLLADADLAVPALGAPSRPRTPRREEPVRVLVADDHAPSCEELCAIVGDAGYLVSAAHGLAEARHRLAEGAFEAALLDLRLAHESALEILRAGAPCPVVLLSGAAELDEAVEGLLLGAAEFVEKGAGADAVRLALGDAIASGGPGHPDGLEGGPASVDEIGPEALAQELAAGALSYLSTLDHRGARMHVFRRCARAPLTSRQRALVSSMLAGVAMKVAAAELRVSEATLWADLGRALSTMGLRDRVTMTAVLAPTAGAWREAR